MTSLSAEPAHTARMEVRANPGTGAAPPSMLPNGRHYVHLDELELQHLTTAAEVREILHLRENIDLSVHTAAGGEFQALEKKETSAGLWVLSCCAASPSAPSASSRWTAD